MHARLVLEHVEPGSGDLAGLERRDERRLVDDRPPGGVDQAGGRPHRAQRSAPIRWWVSGVSGQCRDTTSDARSLLQVDDPGADAVDDTGVGCRAT